MKSIHSFRASRQRPPWWPENEPWPPTRRPHPRFFRRLGGLLLLLNLLGFGLLAGIIIFFMRRLGFVHIPPLHDQWLIPVGVSVLLFVILVIGLGGHGLRRVVIPLDNLLKAADRVGEGDTSVRVQEKGPREVRKLTRAFNNMASRLHGLDERRRDLLADVTHELRTPLTVIQGNVEGMLDGVYPKDEANLRAVLEETKFLSSLVEDLRTLALAESGTLQLKKEATDLALLVRETVDSFRTQAGIANVKLSVETAAGLPWLDIDPGRIRQVLTNLLANALRYTPTDGTITIRYRQEDGQAVLEVQDSGAGIPADELPHVFERYYKSTDSGGMGLGLAISKKLVEVHGGMISATSTSGAGTIIRITVPL
jgi:two-component system sensor histidine kinase BaeS